MTTNQLYKKMVDYLFLVWQTGQPTRELILITFLTPSRSTGDDSVSSICQNGLSKLTMASQDGIWLTNSVNIADQQRLQGEQQHWRQGLHLDRMERGTLLLCKVFIGQAVETTSLAR